MLKIDELIKKLKLEESEQEENVYQVEEDLLNSDIEKEIDALAEEIEVEADIESVLEEIENEIDSDNAWLSEEEQIISILEEAEAEIIATLEK